MTDPLRDLAATQPGIATYAEMLNRPDRPRLTGRWWPAPEALHHPPRPPAVRPAERPADTGEGERMANTAETIVAGRTERVPAILLDVAHADLRRTLDHPERICPAGRPGPLPEVPEESYPPGAMLLQVDPDPAELKRRFLAAVGQPPSVLPPEPTGFITTSTPPRSRLRRLLDRIRGAR